jgi:hypothetical protein
MIRHTVQLLSEQHHHIKPKLPILGHLLGNWLFAPGRFGPHPDNAGTIYKDLVRIG